MRNQKKAGVISALKAAVRSHRILTISTLLCVAASVVASLIPPLLLKNIIDRLTGGMPLLFTAVLLHFGSLVLEGTLSSAQETLLVLFGPARSSGKIPARLPRAFRVMWMLSRRCSLPASSAW